MPVLETSNCVLGIALPRELQERRANDAALAIIDALAKQKTDQANTAIKFALDSPDILVRRRAAAALKENGAGDFSERVGTVKTQFTDADYNHALDRQNRTVRAVVTTTKGVFVLDIMANEAPMTVHSFVTLAERKYFDGIIFHRVVPNFVIQTGDPRGDGNGGPGYAIDEVRFWASNDDAFFWLSAALDKNNATTYSKLLPLPLQANTIYYVDVQYRTIDTLDRFALSSRPQIPPGFVPHIRGDSNCQ